MSTGNAVSRYTIVTAGTDISPELDEQRHRTVQASSIDEAVSHAVDGAADCIVSEYRIGQRTVIDLLDALDDSDSSPPVILWTEHGSERIASQAIHAGVAEYVPRGTDGVDPSISDRIEQSIRGRENTVSSGTFRKYLDAVTEQSGGFVSILDTDGRIEYVSPAVERVFGHDPEEMIGAVSFDYLHPADREPGRRALQSVIDDPGTSITETLRTIDADGNWRDVEVRVCNLVSVPPVDGVVLHTRDVSDRTELERELANERELFRKVLEASPVGISVFDSDVEVVHRNRRAKTILGIGPEMFRERVEDDPEWNIVDVDEDPIPPEETPVARCISSGDPIFDEVVGIRRPDGRRRWLTVNVMPIERDADDSLAVLTFEDITDRRRSQTRLSDSERQFRSVFEECSDAMVLLDDDYRFADANPAACNLFGVHENELLGESVEAFLPDDFDVAAQWPGSPTDADQTVHFPIVRPDGGRVVVEYSATTNVLPGKQLGILHEIDQPPNVNQNAATILDRIGDGFYALDEEWRFTYVNETAETVLQRDREALLGRRIWDEFPETKVSIVWDEFHEAMRTQTQTHFELYYDPLDVQVSVSVYPSETGLSVYFRDVTERQRRARELEDRIEQQRAISSFTQLALEGESLDALFDDAAAIVADVLDHDYCKVLEHHGEDGELLLRNGVGWRDGIVGSARVADDRRSQAGYTLLSEEPVVVEDLETETRFSGPELLTSHDVQGGISTIIGPSDDPWGILGTHDTDRQSYTDYDVRFVETIANVLFTAIERRALERRLDQYRTIVETIDEAVWISNDEKRVVFANERTADALGQPKDALLGQRVTSLLAPLVSTEDRDDEILDALRELLDGDREKFRTELSVQLDGTDRILDVRYVPLRQDGTTVGTVGVARDVTDRHQRVQEIQTARQKYQTMIDAAPDPILALDASTMEVVEGNVAAEQLWGISREELIGTEGSHLHWDTDEKQFQELFTGVNTTRKSVREFHNGDSIEIKNADGDRVPVSISAERLEHRDRTLLFVIYRDESDREWYEKSLTALHETAQELPDAETATEIAENVVDTASTVLDHSCAAVYFYDERDGVLRPSAYSADLESIVGEPPVFNPDDSLAWQVFETGELTVFDDVRTADHVYDANTDIRSELLFPLGDHGVFLAGDTREGVFDQRIVKLTEILVANAEAALERERREQSLRERESRLRTKNQKFQEVGEIGSTVEELTRDVIAANTRAEIEQQICDSLSTLDAVEYAWIATPSDSGDKLVPSASAGQESGYLDSIDLNLDAGSFSREPTKKAAESRSVVRVSNVASENRDGIWKQSALLRDFRSCLSVPLTYDDGFYGVLSLYGTRPEAFSFPTDQLLQHVARLSTYAISAVQTKNALLHTQVRELQFEIDDSTGVLYRLADQLDCRIELLDITPQPDDQYLYKITVDDIDSDEFVTEAKRSFAVDGIEPIDGVEDSFEMRVSNQGIAGKTVKLGGIPRSIVMGQSESRLTVELPEMTAVRSFVQQLDDVATVTLRSQKNRDYSEIQGYGTILEKLTDRQCEVLQTAYDRGYFDQPRDATGQDVADALGISQPAFSKHLQKCQQTLFDSIFDQR